MQGAFFMQKRKGQPMKQRLEIVRGTTNVFGIDVRDEEDRPYTLETGQILVFGLKKKLSDAERVLVKQMTHTVNGEYYLELIPEDTINLDAGLYYYDVGMQHGASIFYNVIEASEFNILQNVTELGDGAT